MRKLSSVLASEAAVKVSFQFFPFSFPVPVLKLNILGRTLVKLVLARDLGGKFIIILYLMMFFSRGDSCD